MIPSDAPSLAPTMWDIDRNGGCRQGHELYEVHMYDSWGDGWVSHELLMDCRSECRLREVVSTAQGH